MNSYFRPLPDHTIDMDDYLEGKSEAILNAEIAAYRKTIDHENKPRIKWSSLELNHHKLNTYTIPSKL